MTVFAHYIKCLTLVCCFVHHKPVSIQLTVKLTFMWELKDVGCNFYVKMKTSKSNNPPVDLIIAIEVEAEENSIN